MVSSRRAVLQAFLVIPAVGLLPKVAGARWPVRGTMIIVPEGDHAECAEGFRVACEGWLRDHPRLQPMGQISFWPYAEDGSPWLVHPSWAELPPAQNPTVLMASASEAFRRPMVIDRAVDLRLHRYWREENPPRDYSEVTREYLRERWTRCKAWRVSERAKLFSVGVTFDAVDRG